MENREMENINELIHEKIFGAKWYVLSDGFVEGVPGNKLRFLRGNDNYTRDMVDLGKYVPAIGNEPPVSDRIPDYSTDIAAAWKVVEKLMTGGNMVSVNGSNETGEWWCVVYPKEGVFQESDCTSSAPMAICLAALAAGEKCLMIRNQ